MTLRLEPVDPRHLQTVALLFGPLVLFAISPDQRKLTRKDLLAAKRIGQTSWIVGTTDLPLKFMPFVEIGEEQYSTYLQIS